VVAGARAHKVAQLLGMGPTTPLRCRWQFAADGEGLDRRKCSLRHVSHRMNKEERQSERILFTCTQPEFAALLLVQIVPILVDRGLCIGSERRFFWVLNDKSQVYRLGRAKPPQQ